MTENLQNIKVQALPSFSAKGVPVDILRLDLLHPVVSGNKWFKLNYYLKDAIAQQKTTVATFGGVWSNHIIATAFAAREMGLKSMGIIRGMLQSPTLQHAAAYGMELVFVDREPYRDKTSILRQYDNPSFYWIAEGGYGEKGAKGAEDILRVTDTSAYTHILCAVGTGTMLSGLARAAGPHQQIVGISVLKNNFSVEQEIRGLLGHQQDAKPFTICHDYHFGGYAKHPPELIGFMNQTWQAENVPTDLVYTSKLLYAAKDLLAKGFFPSGARILLIHSGGLQGNNSLPPGTLPFL